MILAILRLILFQAGSAPNFVAFGDNRMKINKDKRTLTLSGKKYSSRTLVSGNIRLMTIFAGVPWRVGVKRHLGASILLRAPQLNFIRYVS